jgi:MFS family permease
MITLTATPQSTATSRITLLVVAAVFAQESTWNFYDAQVPALLRDHLSSAALIGLLMGMDNLLGIFVQPWIGNRSDRTRTAWGRRIPYLVVGMPLAAALFVLIPHVAQSLLPLVVVMFAYAFVTNTLNPVSTALLPDFIGPEQRSRANAAVKVATSLTIIAAALISLLVVDDHPQLAFAIPAALMLVSVAVLAMAVRDSSSPAYQAALIEDEQRGATADERPRARDAVLEILRDTDRTRLLLVVAILLFGAAWAASRALITPYGMETLGLSRGDAGGLTLPSGVAFLLAAFPAALLAERVGRLRVMTGGMTVFAAAMVVGTCLQSPAGTVMAFSFAAAGAAGFMINAVVVLWNMAPSPSLLGTYAGLYTVGWATGGFLGPAVVGAMVDVTGWDLMLLDLALVAALAVVVVTRLSRLQCRAPTPLA